jgi:hypothetical protein
MDRPDIEQLRVFGSGNYSYDVDYTGKMILQACDYIEYLEAKLKGECQFCELPLPNGGNLCAACGNKIIVIRQELEAELEKYKEHVGYLL